MSFIKIDQDEEGKFVCTLCNGKPTTAEFFYTNKEGECKSVKEPIAIEFTQDNLKKIIEVFKMED